MTNMRETLTVETSQPKRRRALLPHPEEDTESHKKHWEVSSTDYRGLSSKSFERLSRERRLVRAEQESQPNSQTIQEEDVTSEQEYENNALPNDVAAAYAVQNRETKRMNCHYETASPTNNCNSSTQNNEKPPHISFITQS
ncbi:hypothetical protein ROZALSC1DRAFT_29772 [Rozella allomycis CSF55]|uniref:Uncharacterized protein n=1 Tax=Rozella allomycis (strain CSF55) TaxID=988480 RepID=A0A075AUU1_ROZAC|nr:hypothetical protein O9G_004802 [Rozella allomycis CSF55]RKP18552.1 hypothetical protein ROZALSC1DRAFT_29772 [Rozella allomycis CSF55]|eukprot:EPZ32482.1 hypothetical protein O9G_004802 [Rozella allomycis CSF55]